MPRRLVGARAALLFLLAAAQAGAAPFDDGFARCRAQTDAGLRLACYDALPLAGATAASFTGKGGGMTDAFRIDAPQMLTFESDDVVLVAYLLDDTGAVVQNLHRAGAGAGQFLIESPGTYRVQVNATGNWRVSVGPP